jgi:uncharacterized repeat protein (TIGR03847 family)
MDSSWDLPAPEAFVAGTVGVPGERVFYLQARDGELVVTLRCEKQQVAALAEYLDGLLEDLDPAPEQTVAAEVELREPVEEAWVVGPIGVAYDDAADRIIVVLEELVDDSEVDAGRTLRLRLDREQVAAFVAHGRRLVASGRPACRFCGFPVDPSGHPCPRMN